MGTNLDRPHFPEPGDTTKAHRYEALICYNTDHSSFNPANTILMREKHDVLGDLLVVYYATVENTFIGQELIPIIGIAPARRPQKIDPRTMRLNAEAIIKENNAPTV